MAGSPRRGVTRIETLGYRGKSHDVPIFATDEPVVLTAHGSAASVALPEPADSPVLRCLNSTWNPAEFARWSPKCLTNHTYTVSDVLPTAYYVQSFDLSALDERVHDFFWQMNAQVADTNEAHRWQPRPAELTLMDCYSVHIEQLGLRAFRETTDASLRVFPWQDLDGKPLPAGAPNTKPRLRA